MKRITPIRVKPLYDDGKKKHFFLIRFRIEFCSKPDVSLLIGQIFPNFAETLQQDTFVPYVKLPLCENFR